MSDTAIADIELTTLPTPRRRLSLPLVLAVVSVGVVLVCAVFGWAIAPVDPRTQDLATGLSGPSAAHWLGTDDLGRDILSRTIVGARTAVVGPVLVALGAMVIGSILGLTAGYRGGRTDAVIMRWVDLMFSLPGLLIVIVVAGILGGGYFMAVAILIVLFSPSDTRLIRGAALEQRDRPYVEAARTLGVPPRTIMARHIWPNALPVIVANTFLNFAFAIVTLSALSFLGIGVGPGTPDWGRMLSENRVFLYENPWAALSPGIMIVVTAASVSLIGDWSYERLSDRGRSR
jgi:peptide/nickel transport system permease protein